MNKKIKACPFCGCRRVRVMRTNPSACWIRCDGCGAEAASDPKRAGAIKEWNRRYRVDSPAVVVHDMDLE